MTNGIGPSNARARRRSEGGGFLLLTLRLRRRGVHRCVHLDADGVQHGRAIELEGGHIGVAVGVGLELVHRMPGQHALPLVRVLVPAQRVRAEELPLAVVAREHPPPVLSVVLDFAVVVSAAVTVSDKSRASLGREEVLDASLLDAAWLLMSDS
ncbi:hypothetical protein VPH35_044788 [Triticum aestivum]|uniref:Uncharacterized protein n=1 Tax=Triticum urartu TaxID=4572 RepID=A0A8R7TSH7_TRIUA